MAEQKKLDKIKSSVFDRGLHLAKLTLKTSAKLTSYGASSLLSNREEKEQKWKDFLQERARDVSTDLGQLKGSLMKAGQVLSMYGEHFLPPEANELLKTLQSQSPALKWEAIEKVLKSQYSADQLSQLEIDPEPLGSASLGQVHRALIKATGENIVLKIQYPGVDKAIDSDLRALKSILRVLKVLPKELNTEHLFHEVRQMLLQETDYQQEMLQTELYRERLRGDHRFVVPRIVREFCTRQIIASSFERGLSADDPLVQSLSQHRRNNLALNFLDLYLKELFDWGLVQTDPHLGNYRIRLNAQGQDQLVLFDFGAVRTYDEKFLNSYRRMVAAAFHGDRAELHRASLELKFIHPDDPPELLQMFETFCLEMVEPFEDKEYDWKNSKLPQRITRQVFKIIQKFKLRPPPEEILFLDRKTGGTFIFCSVLQARMNSHRLLLKYCRPFRPAPSGVEK